MNDALGRAQRRLDDARRRALWFLVDHPDAGTEDFSARDLQLRILDEVQAAHDEVLLARREVEALPRTAPSLGSIRFTIDMEEARVAAAEAYRLARREVFDHYPDGLPPLDQLSPRQRALVQRSKDADAAANAVRRRHFEPADDPADWQS